MNETEMKIYKTDKREMTLNKLIEKVRLGWELPFQYDAEYIANKTQALIPVADRQRKVKVKMIVKVQEIKEEEEDSVIPAHWLFIKIRWYITGYIPGNISESHLSSIFETINGFVIETGFNQDYGEDL